MKLRILHLEDNAVDADLVRASLARSGLNCDILPVNSGDAFLSALRRPEFDVILCDSGVPGYDGRDALAAAQDQCPVSYTHLSRVRCDSLRQRRPRLRRA